MSYPKINTFTDNTDNFEAQYICFLAKGISLGEYQNNGFTVLPNLDSKNPKSVYFPDLDYSSKFWRLIVSNPNRNLSHLFPKPAINEVKEKLSKYKVGKYEKDIEKIKNEWKRIEKKFFKDVSNFLHFEKSLAKIDEINILITPHGTIGSFNPPRIGNKFKLFVTSRVDMSVGNIASGILQNLYIIENNIGGEIGEDKYIKRMSAIAFLFENTIFKSYYPKYNNLLKNDFGCDLKTINKSNEYLEKLGFKQEEIKININNPIFTKQEKDVLGALIQNTGQIVTFDDMADIIWKDNSDQKFSLEAMAKVIQNIRIKIRTLGINKEVVFTKRGSGYILLQ